MKIYSGEIRELILCENPKHMVKQNITRSFSREVGGGVFVCTQFRLHQVL